MRKKVPHPSKQLRFLYVPPEIGEFLIEMKESLPHGDYTAAVEAAGMSVKNAARYISIAKYGDMIEKFASVRSLPQTLNDYAKVANAYKRGGEEAAEEVIETIVEKKQNVKMLKGLKSN